MVGEIQLHYMLIIYHKRKEKQNGCVVFAIQLVVGKLNETVFYFLLVSLPFMLNEV